LAFLLHLLLSFAFHKEKTMQTRWLGILAVSALVGSFDGIATASPPDIDEVPLTLSGCVVAGEARDSYLLTNVVVEGATMAPPHAFYRFNTTTGLKHYVGRRVEVKGKADLTDVDTGKVKVRTDDGKVTTEVSSERRAVAADKAWFGSIGAMKVDADVATYKFSVDSVKPLAGNCAHADTAR
jgi:hypothetical protein